MKYTKNCKFGIGFGRVGSRAYELTKVWKLGVHAFDNDDHYVFRICYLRTRKATHYWQISIGKRHYDCCCGK